MVKCPQQTQGQKKETNPIEQPAKEKNKFG